ncbi:MAG: hypothetical protein ABI878_05880 [Acidobacteriota bacterium]
MKLTFHLIVSTFLFFSFAQAQDRPKPNLPDEHPATYVDRGACPFECCTYRRWKTRKNTVAYATPNRHAKRVGMFRQGSWVRGLTGEVRTLIPGKFVVQKPFEENRPGDVLWIYTPIGEGFYKVWYGGRMMEKEMIYMTMPRDDLPCSRSKDCLGELQIKPKMVWWAKVRSPAGWTGWTDQPDNFDYIDSCG